MKIIYKKTAIDDLLNTENYIISQSNNKQAAQKLKSTLVNTISLLGQPLFRPKNVGSISCRYFITLFSHFKTTCILQYQK